MDGSRPGPRHRGAGPHGAVYGETSASEVVRVVHRRAVGPGGGQEEGPARGSGPSRFDVSSVRSVPGRLTPRTITRTSRSRSFPSSRIVSATHVRERHPPHSGLGPRPLGGRRTFGTSRLLGRRLRRGGGGGHRWSHRSWPCRSSWRRSLPPAICMMGTGSRPHDDRGREVGQAAAGLATAGPPRGGRPEGCNGRRAPLRQAEPFSAASPSTGACQSRKRNVLITSGPCSPISVRSSHSTRRGMST